MPDKKLQLHRKRLGERVRKLREDRGWSREFLGKRAWPDSDAESLAARVSHVENGLREQGHDNLEALARAFGISIVELLSNARPASATQNLPVVSWNELMAAKRKKPTRMMSILWPRKLSDESLIIEFEDDDFKPFMRGQQVIIDPKAKARDGDFVVVVNGDTQPLVCKAIEKDNNIYFKRLDNNSNPFIEDKKRTRVIGVVISHVSHFR